MEIFENLEPLLKTFWFIAIPTTVIFIVQTIMTFTGSDATDGISADFDSNLNGADAPFQLFSLRNLINFLLGFSWTGISFYNSISNPVILILVALVVGVLFVLFFFMIIKQLQKLAETNSFRLSDAVNKTGEVYLTIPESKKGKGKILISVGGSVHELDAMTEQGRIETGRSVRVVKVESDSLLIVETI